jgi:hypothetical protein
MKKQTLNEQISRIKGMMSLNEQRGDEQSSDSITSPSGNKYYFADNMPKDYKPNNPRIYFNNGGSVSVQASHTHYCEPRNDQGPYSEMEVGFPSEGTIVPDEIMQHLDGNMDAEDFDKHKSVYGYVPISIIKMMVDANDGIKTGELPPMVEVDQETEMNEEQTPSNLVSCSGLGVKSPGLCDKTSKRPVIECAKLGVKSIGYCFIDTKEPVTTITTK